MRTGILLAEIPHFLSRQYFPLRASPLRDGKWPRFELTAA